MTSVRRKLPDSLHSRRHYNHKVHYWLRWIGTITNVRSSVWTATRRVGVRAVRPAGLLEDES